MTDPSFAGQLITFTYPHIGNYGVAGGGDGVRRGPGPARRSCARRTTREDAPGAERGWLDWLRGQRHPGDHRRRHPRARPPHPRRGRDARRRVPGRDDARREARELIAAEPSMVGRDLARDVTPQRARPSTATATGPRIAAIDTGIKGSIVRNLVERGAIVELHPCTHDRGGAAGRATPTRIFLANGPGDPAALDYVVDTLRELVGRQAGVRHLPRPPAAVPGGRAGHLQAARSATAAPTTRSRTCRPGASRSPRRTTASRSSAPDGEQTIEADEPVRWETDFGAAALSPRQPLRPHRRGARRCSTSPAAPSSTTPRPGPGPHDAPVPLRPLPRAGRSPMPRRDDLRRILILGSGPIVIGQAAEFDYSGVQACKVLREEGYEVVLVNSNPATIMTDPEFADATYVEPLLPGPVAAGHRAGAPRRAAADARRPDRAEPRQGAARGRHAGALRRRAHRRELRRDRPRRGPRPASASTMERGRACGCRAARSRTTLAEAEDALERPRPARHRAPGVHARRPRRRHRPHARSEFRTIVARRRSPPRRSRQVLLDQSVLGWGEFELEVMRDHNDNVVIVCSIENIDPMGVHTGDCVTVAPQQTLTDRLYQQLRDQAIAVHPRGRRRDRRLQRAVRGQPGDRGDPRHRDEPARVALQRAGLQGHRVPDREDRRAAGRRLRAGGDPQRHHAADARVASSRRSTTSSSSGRGSPSRSSPAPTRSSRRT